MSYDLYLYKHSDDKRSSRDIWNTLKERIQPNESDVEQQIVYENPSTGVYFIIEINDSNQEPEDIEIFDSFEGWTNLNINFSINFLRPDFFGYESFKMLFSNISDLNLYLLNLQEFDETKHKPIKLLESDILSEWLDSNSRFSKQFFKEYNLSYYPKSKSDSIWNYTSIKDQLEEELKEDIFIPNVDFIKKANSGEIFSYVVWPQSIPILLPQVDYIIILKEYKKLFKKIEETGIIKYSSVLDFFKKEFEIFEHPTCENLKVIDQKTADSMKHRFNKLELEGDYRSFGIQIGKDKFVNYKE